MLTARELDKQLAGELRVGDVGRAEDRIEVAVLLGGDVVDGDTVRLGRRRVGRRGRLLGENFYIVAST